MALLVGADERCLQIAPSPFIVPKPLPDSKYFCMLHLIPYQTEPFPLIFSLSSKLLIMRGLLHLLDRKIPLAVVSQRFVMKKGTQAKIFLLLIDS